MKAYLLDTNIVSELRKTKPHGAVIEWFRNLKEGQATLSAVTLGELQAGIELTRVQNPAKAQEIEQWMDRLSASYQILPMDAACFREWGRLMNGKSDRLIEDAMIAATARVHNLIIATRNEKDFKQFQMEVFNPFTQPQTFARDE